MPRTEHREHKKNNMVLIIRIIIRILIVVGFPIASIIVALAFLATPLEYVVTGKTRLVDGIVEVINDIAHER